MCLLKIYFILFRTTVLVTKLATSLRVSLITLSRRSLKLQNCIFYCSIGDLKML